MPDQKNILKDYLYLDTDLLNSYLAQVFEGLPTRTTSEEQSSETNQEGTSNIGGISLEAAPAGVGAKTNASFADESAESLTMSEKEVLESAFHDYSVDLLIKELEEKYNLKREISELNEGNLAVVAEKFEVLDFEYIEAVTAFDEDFINKMNNISDDTKKIDKKIKDLKSLSKKSKESKEMLSKLREQKSAIESTSNQAVETLQLINSFSKYSKNVFPNTTIIRTNGLLVLADNSLFRNNKTLITSLTDSDRTIKVFGTVVAEKEVATEPFNEGIEDFQPNDLGKIPSLFKDIILSSFSLINDGDKMMKPIAIYFEE